MANTIELARDFFGEAAKKLKDLATRIEKIDYNDIKKYNEISISFDAINKAKAGEIRNQLPSWGKGFYIYVIQASDETDINKCQQQYENAKRNKRGDRAYARLNNNKDSKVFYVGSSRSLGSRIEQHLGLSNSEGVYALQAKHWAEGISGGLTITIWRFPENIGQDKDVFQAIEDGIWEKCKPMFGRRGPK